MEEFFKKGGLENSRNTDVTDMKKETCVPVWEGLKKEKNRRN